MQWTPVAQAVDVLSTPPSILYLKNQFFENRIKMMIYFIATYPAGRLFRIPRHKVWRDFSERIVFEKPQFFDDLKNDMQ